MNWMQSSTCVKSSSNLREKMGFCGYISTSFVSRWKKRVFYVKNLVFFEVSYLRFIRITIDNISAPTITRIDAATNEILYEKI